MWKSKGLMRRLAKLAKEESMESGVRAMGHPIHPI